MLWVTTGAGKDAREKKRMGTKNDVVLYIYGSKGKTDPIPLGDDQQKSYFQPGNTDEFKVIPNFTKKDVNMDMAWEGTLDPKSVFVCSMHIAQCFL